MRIEIADTDPIKASLAARISDRILELGLKQVEAAERLGVDPPKISAIVNGQLGQFGVYRLMRYVAALGSEVRIDVVGPHARGSVRVTS